MSEDGRMRLGAKSGHLRCIIQQKASTLTTPAIDAAFLVCACVVQMLSSDTAKTFQDYAENIFVPYVASQLEKTNRIDIVWNVSMPDSLKSIT